MLFPSITVGLTLANSKPSQFQWGIRSLPVGQKQCIIGQRALICMQTTSVKQSSLLLIPTPWIILAKSPLEFSMVGLGALLPLASIPQTLVFRK